MSDCTADLFGPRRFFGRSCPMPFHGEAALVLVSWRACEIPPEDCRTEDGKVVFCRFPPTPQCLVVVTDTL